MNTFRLPRTTGECIGNSINSGWQYIDDCFMNRITPNLYWWLREHRIDNLDRDAKLIVNALKEEYRRGPW